MKNKIYTSFDEIDRDLAILKLEKEISFQKICFNFKEIGTFFTPKMLLKNIVKNFSSFFSMPNLSSVKYLLPLLFKWFLNKKRSQ